MAPAPALSLAGSMGRPGQIIERSAKLGARSQTLPVSRKIFGQWIPVRAESARLPRRALPRTTSREARPTRRKRRPVGSTCVLDMKHLGASTKAAAAIETNPQTRRPRPAQRRTRIRNDRAEDARLPGSRRLRAKRDRAPVGPRFDNDAPVTSDFDTCFRNLLSNQALMGRQKVVGTTDAWFGRFSSVYGLGDCAPASPWPLVPRVGGGG